MYCIMHYGSTEVAVRAEYLLRTMHVGLPQIPYFLARQRLNGDSIEYAVDSNAHCLYATS